MIEKLSTMECDKMSVKVRQENDFMVWFNNQMTTVQFDSGGAHYKDKSTNEIIRYNTDQYIIWLTKKRICFFKELRLEKLKQIIYV